MTAFREFEDLRRRSSSDENKTIRNGLSDVLAMCGALDVSVSSTQKTFVEDANFRGDGHHLEYTVELGTQGAIGEKTVPVVVSSEQASASEPIWLKSAALQVTRYSHALKTRERDYSRDGRARSVKNGRLALALNSIQPTNSAGDRTETHTLLLQVLDPGRVTETATICTRYGTCGAIEFTDWDKQFRLAHGRLISGNSVIFQIPLTDKEPVLPAAGANEPGKLIEVAAHTQTGPTVSANLGGSRHVIQETTAIRIYLKPTDRPIALPDTLKLTKTTASRDGSRRCSY